MRQGVFQGTDTVGKLSGIGRKFLTEGEWGSIHQMGTADFHHVVKCLGFGSQGFLQALNGGQGVLHYFLVSSNVHGGGIGVVGRLGFVYVVIGVDNAFLTQFAAVQHVGAVGNDFVQIHVGLGAGAGLPNHQRKLLVQLMCQNFVAGGSNQITLLSRQYSQVGIGKSGCFFQIGKGFNDFMRHRSSRADFEVVTRALGLCAPIPVGRHLYFSHGIFFNAKFHHATPEVC